MERLEYNRRQREKRKKNGNAVTHKYEKTLKGFLMRMYRNMQSRVRGIQKFKAHLYQGKKLLERDEFYKWALYSKEFSKLFMEWQEKGYNRKLTPTVDRIDS